MKTKQLLVLVSILVVLGLLVLILENPFGKSEREKKIEGAKPMFPSFQKEQVSKIEITATGQTTTLVKQNDQWLVASMEDYPADGEAVEELLDRVAEFKTTQLASTNPEKQSRFQVDASGVEARLMDSGDNTLAHLFVGKTTPDVFNSYIRAANSDNVYVAKGYLKSVFDRGYRTWKDRTIFDFNKGDVTQLAIKSEDEELELRIDAESKWQMLKPIASAAKGADVESLLDTFSALETDDFAEAKELAEYELDAPKSSISATLNDDSMRTLLIGKEEGSRRYVKREDKDQIFMLNNSRINQLIKK
ncbi:MAG: DUF4340 domain-containing protein, partial [Candidatus Poribacteria bacterium]|nr:DUF4340 domain-containing protein [Candidatus Poribacteria bacterium]